MSVEGVFNADPFSAARNGQTLRFDADGPFGSRLRIGDIVQGKVTQHFDGSRYAVNFGGTEKVVDSALPLTTGELLYGRVVGLDDKVHVRRVYPAQQQPEAVPAGPTAEARSANQALLQDLFAQHQSRLTPAMEAQVLPLMRAHPSPASVALASLILSKLGLQTEPALVRAVSTTLAGERRAVEGPHQSAPALTTDGGVAVKKPERRVIGELAAALARHGDPRPAPLPSASAVGEGAPGDAAEQTVRADTPQAGGGQGERRGAREDQLGRWLLNVQNGGSVSHRLARVPIWFGERLIEVDVALFSQRQATLKDDGVRHRKVVLSLQTESLGRVDVSVYAAGRHLRLHIESETQAAGDTLAAHFADIKAGLGALGWAVDEVSYARVQAAPDGPVRSVVSHYIAEDSLNRVM